MKLTAKTLNLFRDNLIAYSSDKFTEITHQKLALIKLFVAIIVEAANDYHSGNDVRKQEAENYLNHWKFSWHCEALAIDDEVMLRMIKELNNDIDDYDDVE